MRLIHILLLLLSSTFLQAQTTNPAREFLYLHTDRTLYQPGENVWFRAYLTDGQLRLNTPQSDVVSVQLLGPGGETISTNNVFRTGASHDGYINLSPQLKGGRYMIRAYTNWLGNFGPERFFTKYIYVQSIVKPNLLLDLEPERESYGPGQTISYLLTARDRFGEPILNAEVTAQLRIGGAAAATKTLLTSPNGTINLSFTLPANLATTDVLLSATVSADNTTETVLRSVRIILNDVNLRFFPEGGGRAPVGTQKVAFHATNVYGEPADVEGQILADGQAVLSFKSQHNGYGHFVLPDLGNTPLFARLDGLDSIYRLPIPNARGISVTAVLNNGLLSVTPINTVEPFRLQVTREDSVYYASGVPLQSNLQVDFTGFPPGVYQLTLSDLEGRPRWQRLIFHRPKAVEITSFVYQDTFINNVNFRLTDAGGQAVKGNFSVAIVDDGPHTLQNDKQPHLPTQLLLQSQLTGKLYEPNDYFDAEQPEAMAALDDVMLCHGWRMYEWKKNGIVYDPLQTGVYGKVVTRTGSRTQYNKKPLKLNGAKLKPNSDGFYRHRVRDFEWFSLEPSTPQYGYHGSSDYYKYINVKALPPDNLFLPGKPFQYRRRAQKIKTSDFERQQVLGAPTNERLGNAPETSASGVLSEVVVTALGVTTKNMLSGVASIYGRSDINTAYTIRDNESPPSKATHSFVPSYTLVNLQARQAYPEGIQFATYQQKNAEPLKTLFWQPNLKPDKAGQFQLKDRAPDLSATYRIILEGITDKGQPVHVEKTFHTKAPFELETKLPTLAVEGDTLLLTATVRNNGSQPIVFRDQISADATLLLLEKNNQAFTISAGKSETISRKVLVVGDQQTANIKWTMRKAGSSEAVFRQSKIKLLPRLFTHYSSAASAGGKELKILLNAEDYIGKVTATLSVWGNAVDEITRTYATMLREPHGCFEQVTSTAYPNALIVRLLQTRKGDEYTKMIKQARSKLASGYRKLARYEQPKGGFGLWKSGPSQPRYAALALLQFADLNEVWNGVSPAMINRTRLYLKEELAQAKFNASPRQLYQILALTTYGEKGLDDLIRQHEAAVQERPEDHYYKLLLAHVYLSKGQRDLARTQVQSMVSVIEERALQSKSGGAGIGSYYGRSQKIEMLGWFITAYLQTEGYDGIAELAFQWATQLKGKSNYLPTQANVQYLKGITALAGQRPAQGKGSVQVLVNGHPIDTLTYIPGETTHANLDLANDLQPGNNLVNLRFSKQEIYPPIHWQAEWKRSLPPSIDAPPLELGWQTDDYGRVGDVISWRLNLKNTTDKMVNAPMLQVGLPGNLSLLTKDLDPLVERGIVDYYEIEGHYLYLYFTALGAGEARQIPLDLTAQRAGTYHAPPTVVYPYYQPEQRMYLAGPVMRIKR
jgi:hypothetical protein